MPRTYHHGNLREVLIREGVKLIKEKGVAGLTLREIGIRADVSRTAAYRHFSDKAQLLSAIRDAGFAEFADVLEAAKASSSAFSARLTSMGLAYLRFAEERRPYYEVMFGVGCDLGPMENSETGDRAFAVLVGMITDGQTRGDVRPGDPEILARVVWSLVHGVAMLRIDTDFTEGGDGAKFMRTAAEVLRTGL